MNFKNRKHGYILLSIFICICFFSIHMFQKDEVKEVQKASSLKTYLLHDKTLIEYITSTYKKKTEDKIKEIIHYMKQDEGDFTSLFKKDTQLNDVKIKEKGAYLYFDKISYDIKKERKIIESLIYSCTQFEEISFINIYEKGVLLERMPLNHTSLVMTTRDFGINAFESNHLYLHEGSMETLYYLKEINEEEYLVPKSIRIKRKEDYNLILQALCENLVSDYNIKQPFYMHKVRMLKECYFEEGVLHVYLSKEVLDNNNKMKNDCKRVLEATLFEEESIQTIHVHVLDFDFLLNR